MPPTDFLVIDIETVPVVATTPEMTEDERKKKINPIDSRVVAIGVMDSKGARVFASTDEAAILRSLWSAWKDFRMNNPGAPIVGFNVASFDVPFLVTRSFLVGVAVHPFTGRDIVDIRHKLAAYAYGEQRGKLKELAQLVGLPVLDVDGSDVERLWNSGEFAKVEEYLIRDLEITRALYNRLVQLQIDKIQRY
jgi:uncharacterized protein YprB with RNaseH-like and TPR domain